MKRVNTERLPQRRTPGAATHVCNFEAARAAAPEHERLGRASRVFPSEFGARCARHVTGARSARTISSRLQLALALVLAACAPRETQPARAPAAEPQILPRVVITKDSEADIPELYANAVALARAGRHGEAARAFERVELLDPEGPLADDALLQSANEYDLNAELRTSAQRYEKLVQGHPKSPFVPTALARGVRLWSHLEAWPRAGVLARTLLERERELGPYDRTAAYAAVALDCLERDDERCASTFIERGRGLIDEHGMDSAGRVTRELAALYFALGELRRRRGERIRFEPFPPNFPDVMEQRCQLILDAQSAYSDAMRAHDAHWGTMAGIRVGQLYQGLHRDLMRIESPAADTLEKRQLFEGALRLRYSVLLQTALKMLDHTLAMAERTGERSAWVDQGKEVRAAVEREIREEQAALDKLPFSRSTLEQALQDLLERRAKQKAKPE